MFWLMRWICTYESRFLGLTRKTKNAILMLILSVRMSNLPSIRFLCSAFLDNPVMYFASDYVQYICHNTELVTVEDTCTCIGFKIGSTKINWAFEFCYVAISFWSTVLIPLLQCSIFFAKRLPSAYPWHEHPNFGPLLYFVSRYWTKKLLFL